MQEIAEKEKNPYQREVIEPQGLPRRQYHC
jgi:hypothetical protein